MSEEKPENWEGLEPDCFPFDANNHVVLDLYRRQDGGLRIAGRGDARGLVLSGPLPGGVLAKLWPAMHAMKFPITKSET